MLQVEVRYLIEGRHKHLEIMRKNLNNQLLSALLTHFV